MSFLQASWHYLAILNYEVSPDILKDEVPYGTELDLWQGRCYVSLVGFMFRNAKLRGIPVPFHQAFEEVNLRFYTKRELPNETRRGVVFIKELVPKRAVKWVANGLFGEHYETLPMWHEREEGDNDLKIGYGWKEGGREHRLSLKSEKEKRPIGSENEEAFISEHYYGHTKVEETKSFEYEVDRDPWMSYRVKSHEVKVDFEMIYGKRFAFLSEQEPVSVMLFDGSEIRLGKKRILRSH